MAANTLWTDNQVAKIKSWRKRHSATLNETKEEFGLTHSQVIYVLYSHGKRKEQLESPLKTPRKEMKQLIQAILKFAQACRH